VQLIFQDPYASLNPLQNIFQIISEPLKYHQLCNKNMVYNKCKELMTDVGLNETFLERYPHELSGGQRQRVCIARAISVNPQVLICDESVSALDVSIQAKVLNLLNKLKEKYSFTYIFISHDLSVVKYMSDKILVLFNGKVVEYQDADLLFKKPKNDYTKKLIKASL
jgi:peptide/nickel transport system ATP-binding protein